MYAAEKEWQAGQKDGTVVPRAPKALNTRGHNALARENITKFVAWSTAFGVDEETILFESEDLVSLTSRKHKVLVLILDIARLAHHAILPACILAEREHAELVLQQREARRINQAAQTIQRGWRAYTAAKREQELAVLRAAQALHLAQLTRAATLAQAWWRRTVARRAFVSKRAAVVQIQRSIRAALARAAYQKKLAAIQTIQNVFRMHLAKLVMRKKAEEARRRKLHEEAMARRAATVLQAGWRGRVARLEFAATKRKVVAIQSVVRAYLARQQAEVRRAAVLRLQCVFRMYLAVQARKELEVAAEKARVEAHQRRSAVVIQSLVRMYLVKRQLPALRDAAEQRRRAAELAQIAAEEAKRAEHEARLKAEAETKARQLAAEQELARRAVEAEKAKHARERHLVEQRRLEALSKKKLENNMMREKPGTFKLKFKLRKVNRAELPKHVDGVRASVVGEADAPTDDAAERTPAAATAPPSPHSPPDVAPVSSARIKTDAAAPAAAAAVAAAPGKEIGRRNGERKKENNQEPASFEGKLAQIKAGGNPAVNLNKAGVTDEQVDKLVAAIKANSVTGVHLDLEGNSVTDAGAAALATLLGESRGLASLKLGFNKVTADGAAALAEQLKHDSTLTLLELNYNSIEDVGAEALADALKENTTLTVVGLYKCRIGDDGLWALAETLIEGNSAVQVLALGMNRFGSGAFEVLCEAIRRGNLMAVKVDGNDLRHEDVGCLADAIRGNSALKTLDLRSNKIGNLGAKHLAAALVDDCGLTLVDVRKNKITSRGVEAFVNAGVLDRVLCEGVPTVGEATVADPAGGGAAAGGEAIPAVPAEAAAAAEPAAAAGGEAIPAVPAEAAAAATAADPAAPPPVVVSKRYLRLKETSLDLALEAWQREHPGEDHVLSSDWAAAKAAALGKYQTAWDTKESKAKEENDALVQQLAEMEAKLEVATMAKEAAEAQAAGFAKLDDLEAESSALQRELVALLKRASLLEQKE